MINDEIKSICERLLNEADQTISPERKLILNDLASTLGREILLANSEKNEVAVVYLCTHNSRRSHFAQVWGHIASVFFNVQNLKVYSGGTVATFCHPNTIKALRQMGFDIQCDDLESENPFYKVYYNDNDHIACYSKANTNESIPQTDFIAVMTCSDKDDNCPLVPGAKKRFSTTYDDPKEFDESEDVLAHYTERGLQIATEIMYTFNQLSKEAK